jgi:RimJ/RimL family protein N-acetyltransferase
MVIYHWLFAFAFLARRHGNFALAVLYWRIRRCQVLVLIIGYFKQMKLTENKRFILRTIKKEDAVDVARNVNDKTISRNTAAIPYPYKLKDAKDWIEKCLTDEKKKERKVWSFVIVIENEVVGSIGLHDIEKNHKAEIGYWLARKHWGKGIVPEAVKIVTDFGFKKLNLKRIYAGVYPFNQPSMRVLEKNGYKLEGIHKKAVKKNKNFIDKCLYAKVK